MSRTDAGNLLRQTLDDLATARCAERDARNRHPKLQPLKQWQQDRLARSFTSLSESPRYGPAAAFFISDLYGVDDVRWRDRDVARVLPTMVRWLPEKALLALNGALELDLMSHRFDLDLCEQLRRGAIDAELYGEAYRATCDPAGRHRQIDLIVEVGRELERLVRIPMIIGVLKLARGPARGAGFGQLQTFLERGFKAFRHMGAADEFLSTIERGERQVMRRLLASHPDPFGFDREGSVSGRTNTTTPATHRVDTARSR